jgi:hypothetical protein
LSIEIACVQKRMAMIPSPAVAFAVRLMFEVSIVQHSVVVGAHVST